MNKAFTLIELAIVIVIIGLITGGVMGAQSLIQSAKLRAQITQLKEMDQATAAFKLEYDAWPGDMLCADAYEYGFSGTSCGVLSAGDGRVNYMGGTTTPQNPPDVFFSDSFMFFTHLMESGIANFTDTAATGTGYFTIGRQIPKSELGNGAVVPFHYSDLKFYWFLGIDTSTEGTALSGNGYWGDISQSGVLTPKQAKQLDDKLDDGKPLTGMVRSIKVSGTAGASRLADDDVATNCMSDSVGTSYYLSNTDNDCRMIIGSSVK